MQQFNYKKVGNVEDAFKAMSSRDGSATSTAAGAGAGAMKFLAGGTTLIDLMKLEVETPKVVIDVSGLPFSKIEKTKDGGAFVGAFVKNSDLAHDTFIAKTYSVLSQAILAGASAQLRNKATTSGNLLQRTRCVYFRDNSKACNKRNPGSGCAAIDGFNRNLAILGTSSKCIASNPSDMNVAMMALEAVVKIQSASATREVAIGDFFLLPGETPEKETVLAPGDLITGVTLPAIPDGSKSLYLKLRDRASYEFALASTAVIAKVSGGKFERVRIAMGGIGSKPWRSVEVEKMLEGNETSEANMKRAADEFLRGAKPASENAFKVELAKRCLVHALKQVAKA